MFEALSYFFVRFTTYEIVPLHHIQTLPVRTLHDLMARQPKNPLPALKVLSKYRLVIVLSPHVQRNHRLEPEPSLLSMNTNQ